MNTIILFWNPDISSYTIERLREERHFDNEEELERIMSVFDKMKI